MPALGTHSITRTPRPDDPAMLAVIAKATAKGHPVTTAAELAGLGASTGTLWYRLGKEELEAGDEQGSHVAFMATINRARATMAEVRLTRIDEAGEKGMWQADMTVLERRMPEDFGRFQRIEVESKSLVINLTGTLPPGALEALHALAEAETKRLPAQTITTPSE